MRTKRKKILYVMFLLITVLMFLHSWKAYVSPANNDSNYAHKHHHKKGKHPLHDALIHHVNKASNGIEHSYHA